MNEDFYIFIDETGIPNLDSQEPFFGIQAICVSKQNYGELAKNWNNIKFKFWPENDFTVFHSNKIRKKVGIFSIFKEPSVLEEFSIQISSTISGASLEVFLIGVNLSKYKERYGKPYQRNPYELTLGFLLEKLGNKYGDSEAEICFESRGKKEDSILLDEFQKLTAGNSEQHWVKTEKFDRMRFEARFFSKKEKICGLEIADFYGYEFSRRFRGKETRGWSTLSKKLAWGGYKIFP